MVISTWGSQFLAAARALGDPERGMLEARATFMLDPEIRRAAPAFYEVQSGGISRHCQRRSACCLYFKVTSREFCASCPIIPEAERLQRQRTWVAGQLPSSNAEAP